LYIKSHYNLDNLNDGSIKNLLEFQNLIVTFHILKGLYHTQGQDYQGYKLLMKLYVEIFNRFKLFFEFILITSTYM
jgi:hypothetical protein